ncbi:hypothetical protein AL755_12400 [Arthrobacter sp. ERGS1:01]|uniref:PH-like domain-containing protein n=1 Tax=Arthrobacter sp. ERGS1:01 TaxID=1704044 RepID=UPI0006B40A22|nr:hypothetical protein [Arthrobacter sp. ERGS1:01]ALE06083.1 hypothetical protein AL755_12400 [Arthrobacter sp. ERGS1:01]
MGDRTVPTILAIALVVVVFALIGWGWRNKLKSQAAVAPLPELPGELGPASLSVPGQYVVTTATGDWLARIAVHGLGVRTPAELSIHPEGVLLSRSGAADLFISTEALTEVTTQAGMAGKFVEKDGLVVLSWTLGSTAVDTGFRTTEAVAKRPLVDALKKLLPNGGTDELS